MPNHDCAALAIGYVQRGWAVLPLHHIESGACSCKGRSKGCKPGKHPRTARGVKDASINPAKVRKWWRDWPLANIGIATGAVSSLVVLDVDGEDARRVLHQTMQSMGVMLPETWTARTGKGWHHYFAIPSGLAVPSVHPVNPISLQGDGAYVVGVGSIHVSGWRYSWEHALDDRPLATAPDWLLGSAWSGLAQRIASNENRASTARGDAPLGLAPLRSERAGAGNGSAPPRLACAKNPIPTREDPEDPEDGEDHVDHVWLGDTPESLIEHLKLTGPGQTDKRAERLIRGLKLDLDLSLPDGLPWVKRWHTLNARHITDEHEWWAMEDKAQRGWKTFRIPLRSDAAVRAEQLARVGPICPEVDRYTDRESIQRTIGICAHLQALAPGIPFILSTRQLARALGHNENGHASTILRTLQADGLMQCVQRGTQGVNGRAAKWLYLGTLPVLPCMDENNSATESDK